MRLLTARKPWDWRRIAHNSTEWSTACKCFPGTGSKAVDYILMQQLKYHNRYRCENLPIASISQGISMQIRSAYLTMSHLRYITAPWLGDMSRVCVCKALRSRKASTPLERIQFPKEPSLIAPVLMAQLKVVLFNERAEQSRTS